MGDEMKINLRTSFMRNLVKKFIVSAIKKKTGIKPDMVLDELSIEKSGDRYHIHVSLDASISDSDLLKITRIMEMED